MDKGFAKVEPDLTLLTRFRHICYDANDKLEKALYQLNRFETLTMPEHLDKEASQQLTYEINLELQNIREIISNNIEMISDYIHEFSDLWEKTFSLIALQKFQHLLISEFNLLNKEIELLTMRELLDRRQEILKGPDSAKVGNEKYQ